jgi:guanine nucleotide-binding protein G(i) subunit alpha
VQAQRIATREYVPSDEDILRAAEKPTAGMTEIEFCMGQLSVQLCRVNGQRSERKKWIHHFESVTSIIFCVPLSDYDQEDINAGRGVCILLPFSKNT